jgi:hypothetical protein
LTHFTRCVARKTFLKILYKTRGAKTTRIASTRPTNDELTSVFVTPIVSRVGMSMMMSASSASKNASNCAKQKKKRLAHKLSSKIQKEVQNLILPPAMDEVYKSKVMSMIINPFFLGNIMATHLTLIMFPLLTSFCKAWAPSEVCSIERRYSTMNPATPTGLRWSPCSEGLSYSRLKQEVCCWFTSYTRCACFKEFAK